MRAVPYSGKRLSSQRIYGTIIDYSLFGVVSTAQSLPHLWHWKDSPEIRLSLESPTPLSLSPHSGHTTREILSLSAGLMIMGILATSREALFAPRKDYNTELTQNYPYLFRFSVLFLHYRATSQLRIQSFRQRQLLVFAQHKAIHVGEQTSSCSFGTDTGNISVLHLVAAHGQK